MSKKLIIIFVKNIKLGKVKTRLAKTVGNGAASKVYEALVDITELATSNIQIEKRIYFSDAVVASKWPNAFKTTQSGIDLGERMKHAFHEGFNDGYKSIVLLGSDLPNISSTIITKGLNALDKTEIVFGPAEDGGYYLVGMNKPHAFIFENKPWSDSKLLETTLNELKNKNIDVSLLETLNDIDTFEDLKQYPEFLKLIS